MISRSKPKRSMRCILYATTSIHIWSSYSSCTNFNICMHEIFFLYKFQQQTNIFFLFYMKVPQMNIPFEWLKYFLEDLLSHSCAKFYVIKVSEWGKDLNVKYPNFLTYWKSKLSPLEQIYNPDLNSYTFYSFAVKDANVMTCHCAS